MPDKMTLAQMLEMLGFKTEASDLDETLKWVLVDLYLTRRRLEKTTERAAWFSIKHEQRRNQLYQEMETVSQLVKKLEET